MGRGSGSGSVCSCKLLSTGNFHLLWKLDISIYINIKEQWRKRRAQMLSQNYKWITSDLPFSLVSAEYYQNMSCTVQQERQSLRSQIHEWFLLTPRKSTHTSNFRKSRHKHRNPHQSLPWNQVLNFSITFIWVSYTSAKCRELDKFILQEKVCYNLFAFLAWNGDAVQSIHKKRIFFSAVKLNFIGTGTPW